MATLTLAIDAFARHFNRELAEQDISVVRTTSSWLRVLRLP